MKNSLLRELAIECIYQKVLRLLREEDEKIPRYEPDTESRNQPDERARSFVASMARETQLEVAFYVEKKYSHEEFEEFLWLMPKHAPITHPIHAAVEGSLKKPTIN